MLSAKNNMTLMIIFIIVVILNIFLILKGIADKVYFRKEINSYVIKDKDYDDQFIKNLHLLSQEISVNCDSVFKCFSQKSFLLIYTYSGEECNKCIFEDIDALKKILNRDNAKKIIVLPVMENNRIVNLSLKADLETINYKRLSKGLVKFPYQNGIQKRFFAVLTPQGKILLPFFPESNAHEKTDVYLDFIFNKYLSNDADSMQFIKFK